MGQTLKTRQSIYGRLQDVPLRMSPCPCRESVFSSDSGRRRKWQVKRVSYTRIDELREGWRVRKLKTFTVSEPSGGSPGLIPRINRTSVLTSTLRNYGPFVKNFSRVSGFRQRIPQKKIDSMLKYKTRSLVNEDQVILNFHEQRYSKVPFLNEDEPSIQKSHTHIHSHTHTVTPYNVYSHTDTLFRLS